MRLEDFATILFLTVIVIPDGDCYDVEATILFLTVIVIPDGDRYDLEDRPNGPIFFIA